MENKEQRNKTNTTTVPYTLFLYREELRRRNTQYIRLSKTKIYLTDGLISKTVRNITRLNVEELKNLSREIMFKKKLRHQVKRLRRLQEIGITNPNPNAMTTEL